VQPIGGFDELLGNLDTAYKVYGRQNTTQKEAAE
jgi:hypothetical protein